MDLKSRLKQQLGGNKNKQKMKAEPEVSPASVKNKPLDNNAQPVLVVDLPEVKKKKEKKEKEKGKGEPDHVEDYLTTHELKYRTILLDKLLSVMDLARIGDIEPEKARTQILNLANNIILDENLPINSKSRERVTEAVQFEILGLGPLEYLIRDKRVSDIMINGAKNSYVERGGRLEKTNVVFDDDAHLMRIIDRIASQVGRRVDESSPMVDARLKDGSRVNAIVPPLALDGPSLSIRRFPADPLTLKDLIGFGAITLGMAKLMTASVEAGKNILISGGTGSATPPG